MILSRVIHNLIYIILISNVVIRNIPIYIVTQSGPLTIKIVIYIFVIIYVS